MIEIIYLVAGFCQGFEIVLVETRVSFACYVKRNLKLQRTDCPDSFFFFFFLGVSDFRSFLLGSLYNAVIYLQH